MSGRQRFAQLVHVGLQGRGRGLRRRSVPHVLDELIRGHERDWRVRAAPRARPGTWPPAPRASRRRRPPPTARESRTPRRSRPCRRHPRPPPTPRVRPGTDDRIQPPAALQQTSSDSRTTRRTLRTSKSTPNRPSGWSREVKVMARTSTLPRRTQRAWLLLAAIASAVVVVAAWALFVPSGSAPARSVPATTSPSATSPGAENRPVCRQRVGRRHRRHASVPRRTPRVLHALTPLDAQLLIVEIEPRGATNGQGTPQSDASAAQRTRQLAVLSGEEDEGR